MRRIERAYCNRFLAHVGRLKARRLDKAARWFGRAVRDLVQQRHLPAWEAARLVWERVWARSSRRFGKPLQADTATLIRFRCDSGLGKLARWLRAAGYEADWREDWDDAELLQRCAEDGAVLLTTDSLLMERSLLRDGTITALWIPPAYGVEEQLRMVLRELKLPLSQPRCMQCGGALRPRKKEEVAAQIPPRTLRWLDEYFQCERCGKLFGKEHIGAGSVLSWPSYPSKAPAAHHGPHIMNSEPHRDVLGDKALKGVELELFVRYAGCPFCRKLLARLKEVHPLLKKKGVTVRIIHPGRPGALQALLRQMELDSCEEVADPEGRLFEQTGMKRLRPFGLLSPRTWLAGFRAAMVEGYGWDRPVGSVLQLGGLIVRRRGVLVYRWVQSRPEEEPDWKRVLAAINEALRDCDHHLAN